MGLAATRFSFSDMIVDSHNASQQIQCTQNPLLTNKELIVLHNGSKLPSVFSLLGVWLTCINVRQLRNATYFYTSHGNQEEYSISYLNLLYLLDKVSSVQCAFPRNMAYFSSYSPVFPSSKLTLVCY